MTTWLPPILHHEDTKEKQMSRFNFLVKVETDREKGLIVSRDEQAEKIIEALEQAGEFAELTGLGARSDSDYAVQEVEVYELDDKALKAEMAEYDMHVKAEEPSNKELRQELKLASDERDRYRDLYERQRGIVEQLLASPEFEETRIWTQTREGTEKVRHFLPDGRYDHVFFKLDDVDDDSSVSIRIEDNGDLELRSNAMGREIMVLPRSGNELGVRVARRRA